MTIRIIAFFLFPFTLLGQLPVISSGDQFEFTGSIEYLDKDEDHYYLLQSKSFQKKKERDDVFLIKMNYDNELQSRTRESLKSSTGKTKYLKSFKTKTSRYILSAVFHTDKNQFELFSTSFKLGEFGESKSIFSHPFNSFVKTSDHLKIYKKKDVECQVNLSTDNSKMVFSNQMALFDSDAEKEKIALAIFDDEMNLMWEKIQELPYTDEQIDIQNTIVSNDGLALFLLGKVTLKNKKKSFKVFHITKSTLQEYSFDIGESETVKASTFFYNDETKTVTLSGVYTSLDDIQKIGLFSVNFEGEEKSVKVISKISLEQEVLSALLFDRESKNKKLSFHILESVKLGNGNMLTLIEFSRGRYVGRKLNSYGEDNFYGAQINSTGRSHSFLFKGFILCTKTKDGAIINIKHIPHYLQNKSSEVQHLLLANNDQVSLLVHSSILKKDKEKFNLSPSRNTFVSKLFQIDENGNIVKEDFLHHTQTKKGRKNYKLNPLAFMKESKLFYGGILYNSVTGFAGKKKYFRVDEFDF